MPAALRVADVFRSHWREFCAAHPVAAHPGRVVRHTHKVAISDHRLLKLHQGQVTFAWRDRSDGNRLKNATVPTADFIARFLLHVLPEGFAKVRYFGWLASRHKKPALCAIRAALGARPPPAPPSETAAQRILRLTGVDVCRCPHCGRRALTYIGRLIPTAPRAPP